jgi:hypothetical protein
MTTPISILAWGALLIAITAGLLPFVKRERSIKRARRWPSVIGRVIETSTRTWDARGQAIWWVRYQYVVDSVRYTGKLCSELQQTIVPDANQSVSTVFPIGSEIEVRYNPETPEESVAVGTPSLLSPSFDS